MRIKPFSVVALSFLIRDRYISIVDRNLKGLNCFSLEQNLYQKQQEEKEKQNGREGAVDVGGGGPILEELTKEIARKKAQKRIENALKSGGKQKTAVEDQMQTWEYHSWCWCIRNILHDDTN